MQRRTFLLSVGGTAIAGGAALGSGAFSQVEADRDMTVSVVNDSAGFLEITPGDHGLASDFVTDGNPVTISIDTASTTDQGDGLNAESVTAFGDSAAGILNFMNTTTSAITVTHDPADELVLYTGYHNDTTTGDFQITDGASVTKVSKSLDPYDSSANSGSGNEDAASVQVGIAINTKSTPPGDFNGNLSDGGTASVTIRAE